MEIKEFKNGQKAYALYERRGGYTQQEQTVASVGRKYVVLDNGHRYVATGDGCRYLNELCEYGTSSLLFADKDSLSEHIEKKELVLWLRGHMDGLKDLSLSQLRKMRQVMEGSARQPALLLFEQGSIKSAICTSIDEEETDVYSMFEQACEAAAGDGITGWASNMPPAYLEAAGFQPMDCVVVKITDKGLAAPEYEKNGYYRSCCMHCYRCEDGWCGKYWCKADLDDVPGCFTNADAQAYEIVYRSGREDRILVQFFRYKEQGPVCHPAPEILGMFAPEDVEIRELMASDSFDASCLYIVDEKGEEVALEKQDAGTTAHE